MAASIVVSQALKPVTPAGQAREDLDLGTAVTLTASGGPFLSHFWSIVDKPIDIESGVRSSAALSAPTASSTNVSPIDKAGTFLVQLAVDSGSGLGALPGDVARITFYAGPALNADPTLLPRRQPATGETSEHNVPDAVDAGGNPDGWAREELRISRVLSRVVRTYRSALVTVAGVDTGVAGVTTLLTGVPAEHVPVGMVFVPTEVLFETTTGGNPGQTFDFQVGSNDPDWDDLVASTADVQTAAGLATSASEAVWNATGSPFFPGKVYESNEVVKLNIVAPSADSSVVTCHLVGYLVPKTP